MRTEDLKEYLGIVVDMEQSVYLQKNLLSNINREIEILKTPQKIDDPPEPALPVRPSYPKAPSPDVRTCVLGLILVCTGGCIGLFFAAGIVALTVMELCANICGVRRSEFDWMMLASLVVPVVWAAHLIIEHRRESKKYRETRDRAEAEYREVSRKYQEQCRLEKERYQRELAKIKRLRQQDEQERRIKTVFLEKQREDVEESLGISEKRLQTIYSKNIIFPKYRNLVMACSLYEYICAGRCTELEGPDGAYNILEIEIRLDRIIVRLDEALKNLDRIELHQYELYAAVQEVNQRIIQISGSLSSMSAQLNDFYCDSVQLGEQLTGLNAQNAILSTRIAELQKTSAFTAYHAERTQKELAYMNRMDYLSGRNDDVFFNHPPV